MKGKAIYFTAQELEALADFANHWGDKLTEADEEHYAYWLKRTGTAFAKVCKAKNESFKNQN